MKNGEIVRLIYQAFGRGDVPAILEHLDTAVEWEYGGGTTNIPWLQPLSGPQEVPRFFEALARELKFEKFEQKALLEDANLVVVLFDLEATVKSNGRKIVEEDEVHIWHFNDKGKVTGFRHRVDTHQHALAIS